jgi:hypothetical protein
MVKWVTVMTRHPAAQKVAAVPAPIRRRGFGEGALGRRAWALMLTAPPAVPLMA